MPWNRTGTPTFKKKRRGQKYMESIMFIPHTPDSAPRNRLSKLEEPLNFATRLKYIEEIGRTRPRRLQKGGLLFL